MKDNSSKTEEDSTIETSENSSNKTTGSKGIFKKVTLGIESRTNNNSTVSCPNCGTENPRKSKFCKKCGAEIKSTVICPECGSEVKDSKFCAKCGATLVSEESYSYSSEDESFSNLSEKVSSSRILIICGIVGIVLIALFLLFGSNSSSEFTANGFTVDLPGYSVDNYTAGFGGKVVPMYMFTDENGENVLNISYLPSEMGGDAAVKNLESYMADEGYDNIKSCKIADASGYKGVSKNYDSKGKKTAFISLKDSDYCYVIDYNNKGNLSLLNDNINFTKDKIPVTVTKPDSSISLSDGQELNNKYFTLKAPDDWTQKSSSTTNGKDYSILSDKGSVRIKIAVTDLSAYDPTKEEIENSIQGVMTSLDSSNVKKYKLGSVTGKSFYSKQKGGNYQIVASKDGKVYMMTYTDEESLKVLNTIKFK